MEDATLIKMREDSQYGTETTFDDAKMKKLLEDTKNFVVLVKSLL
jgi:hypothetical protein